MCACYHPLKIFYTGRKTENGGKEGVITQGFLKMINVKDAEKKLHANLKINELKGVIADSNGNFFLTMNDDIPCGHCNGCKISYSQDWATRVMMEAREFEAQGKYNCFLTLTYDDEHLPNDGKLAKKDMQKFWKRFRKKYGKQIRIAYSGEYGELTHRAHYHACVMNLKEPFKDLAFWDGKTQVSQELNKVWGKGRVNVGTLTHQSAAYVAKYTLKKHDDPDSFYITSRRPGLGYGHYIKQHQTIGEGVIYYYDGQIKRLPIPKYYKYRLKQEDPETMEALAEAGKASKKYQDNNTVANYQKGNLEKTLNYLEEQKGRKLKRSKRPLNG